MMARPERMLEIHPLRLKRLFKMPLSHSLAIINMHTTRTTGTPCQESNEIRSESCEGVDGPYEYEASGGIPGVLVRKLGSKTVLREMPHRIGAVPHPPGGVPRRAS